jgi:pimeloyl-ACP methyl ester carboxylesterase
MTLNATIFPPLELSTLSPDFTTLVASPNGDLDAPAGSGMTVYTTMLDGFLEARPEWSASRRLVIGHSFGGMLALRWLLDESPAARDVMGLILVGTTAGPMFDSARVRMIGGSNWEWRMRVGPFMRFWNRPLVTRTVKRVMTGGSLQARPVDFSRIARPTDLALDRAGWRNTDWRAMRSYRLAIEGFDVRDRLEGLRIPTIVLHGTRDALFPADEGRRLAEGIPDADFRLVQGAAHGLPLTHPDILTRAVRDLLDRRP